MLGRQVRRGGDMVLGHDEDVRRRARRDVADREDGVVLVDLRRRDLAGDDPAEQAVGDAVLAHRLTTAAASCS